MGIPYLLKLSEPTVTFPLNDLKKIWPLIAFVSTTGRDMSRRFGLWDLDEENIGTPGMERSTVAAWLSQSRRIMVSTLYLLL